MIFSETDFLSSQTEMTFPRFEVNPDSLLLGPEKIIIPGMESVGISVSWETKNVEGFPIYFICYRIYQPQSWLIRYRVIVSPEHPQGQYLMGSGATSVENQTPEWWEPDWNHSQPLEYGKKTLSELIYR